MWTEPKTNWTSDDYINIGDYHRIIDNLNHIENLMNLPVTEFIRVTYASIPKADMFNKIEDALEAINKSTYDLNIGRKKTFRDGGSTIDWNELNRIESATKRLYDAISEGYVILNDRLPTVVGRKGELRNE